MTSGLMRPPSCSLLTAVDDQEGPLPTTGSVVNHDTVPSRDQPIHLSSEKSRFQSDLIFSAQTELTSVAQGIKFWMFSPHMSIVPGTTRPRLYNPGTAIMRPKMKMEDAAASLEVHGLSLPTSTVIPSDLKKYLRRVFRLHRYLSINSPDISTLTSEDDQEGSAEHHYPPSTTNAILTAFSLVPHLSLPPPVLSLRTRRQRWTTATSPPLRSRSFTTARCALPSTATISNAAKPGHALQAEKTNRSGGSPPPLPTHPFMPMTSNSTCTTPNCTANKIKFGLWRQNGKSAMDSKATGPGRIRRCCIRCFRVEGGILRAMR
ncbi:hypothetical protein G7K_6657-t1 [Saitoella complicata NRRL Y-17804]|uniref:Uncharacterized protein n=1 Tax=Saitoella complicata (strain BCRC 22490 / CBS 7301 / JCM 7358 / NBRC 10748 / NRRL Y-17804) TaxID=698492 RepID=A0A0E9NRT9_SAICN|nr:hypothetical protein G7K_6657-t1 [Saitoella complicata NRRL Y-17804]